MEPQLRWSRPTPQDIVSFLPYACNQLQAPFAVTVLRTVQDEYVSNIDEKTKKLPKGKSSMIQTSRNQHSESKVIEDTSDEPALLHLDSDSILITAVFNVLDKLVELRFHKCCELPRLLMKVIGLCIPFHVYLTKITIRYVPLEAETLYEMAKFLPQSYLTDINLDDSPVLERNYYIILEQSQLKRLSLARCDIRDADCAVIALKLVCPLPAATHLLILSLVSNEISDVGAAALGEALRTNRSLQYLNLSGNQISDVGATSILQSLMKFKVTLTELITKRQHMIEYLKVKREVFDKCMKIVSAQEKTQDEVSQNSKRKTMVRRRKTSVTAVTLSVGNTSMDSIVHKAETMTKDLIGTFTDPFSMNETQLDDKCLYCVGNTTLCYLNLSYNCLSYETLLVLERVLKCQSLMTHKSGLGLIRVVIEGNDMPVECNEYSVIDELLDKSVICKTVKPVKRIERGKSKLKQNI